MEIGNQHTGLRSYAVKRNRYRLLSLLFFNAGLGLIGATP
jgi:hypothetical protein